MTLEETEDTGKRVIFSPDFLTKWVLGLAGTLFVAACVAVVGTLWKMNQDSADLAQEMRAKDAKIISTQEQTARVMTSLNKRLEKIETTVTGYFEFRIEEAKVTEKQNQILEALVDRLEDLEK